MAHTIQRLPNNTIDLTITIPWAEVQKTYDHVVDEMVQNAEVEGFRKGKAPRKIVEEKLDKSKTYEEVLRHIIPKAYGDAVEAEKLHPIVIPKVEIKDAKENSDWTFIAHTCEKPDVDLGDYKKAVIEAKTASQKKIWLPGQEPEKKPEEKDKKPAIDELLKALYGAVKVTIPDLLVENEANRLLSDLLDQTKKLGLTVEQYLSSTGRTGESVRAEYADQARRTFTLEFALEKIADTEGILISDDDIDTVIKTAKDDNERKAMEKERYYLASVLRRQKTLDFLSNL
jgi:trigger factor